MSKRYTPLLTHVAGSRAQVLDDIGDTGAVQRLRPSEYVDAAREAEVALNRAHAHPHGMRVLPEPAGQQRHMIGGPEQRGGDLEVVDPVSDVRVTTGGAGEAAYCLVERKVLAKHAYHVGRGLAERGLGLVYGGGGGGLMGQVSQGALDAGGEVIGVFPRTMMEREWGRHDLTELHVVETMHERKALMAQ